MQKRKWNVKCFFLLLAPQPTFESVGCSLCGFPDAPTKAGMNSNLSNYEKHFLVTFHFYILPNDASNKYK